jgi:transposase InsO family protein
MELTMGQRKGVTTKLAKQYRGASKKKKGEILDTLVNLTGYNRCYAGWVLRHYGKRYIMEIDGEIVEVIAGPVPKKAPSKPRPRYYDEPVKKVLTVIWETFDYMCGQRLAPMLKETLPVLVGRGEIHCNRWTYEKLMKISPATIDRLLREEKNRLRLKGTSHTTSAGVLKAEIPIRTWAEAEKVQPGHLQIDLVGHDGGDAHGKFAYSLDAIDLYSGWVEPRVVKNRAHRWTLHAIQDVQAHLPVKIQSIHTDNGGEFINKQLVAWTEENHIAFYRSRAYRKNDTCFVEQKNYNVIRQAVGYSRFDREEEIEMIRELYSYLRLLVNHFYPSAKLLEKIRKGSKVYKKYDQPKTPYRRLLNSPHLSDELKDKLKEEHRRLRPMELKHRIITLQNRLYTYAKKKRYWSGEITHDEETNEMDHKSLMDYV